MRQNLDQLPKLLPQWSAQLTTRSGLELNIRPAGRGDEAALGRFYGRVTPNDLRFRFLSSVKADRSLAESTIAADPGSVESLLAFDAGDGSLAATGTVAGTPGKDEAEIAVLVRSDLKDRGVGWSMLDHCCEQAAALGFGRAVAVEFSDNRAAIGLEREFGFKAHQHPEDSTLTILSKVLS